MDRLDARVVPLKDWPDQDSLELRINGQLLADLVEAVELPFARAEERTALQWAGVTLDEAPDPVRHFLAQVPVEELDDENGKVSILGCVCGILGCGRITARISTTGETVIWRDFENPWDLANDVDDRTPWSYATLGPFVFDRAQYVSALEEALNRPRRRRKKRSSHGPAPEE